DPTNPDPSEKDNLNVKLSGASSVVEGENATYKVSLTDDDGNVVKAIEDMTVTFKYTYPSDGASGDDIVEVKTVTVKKGESEVSFNVKAVDDVYKEGSEKFKIAIDSATGTTNYEKVSLDKTAVETTITD
ncbi:hypothetical protein CP985_14495, partial [Malaciobacter mytili LMG 24559]